MTVAAAVVATDVSFTHAETRQLPSYEDVTLPSDSAAVSPLDISLLPFLDSATVSGTTRIVYETAVEKDRRGLSRFIHRTIFVNPDARTRRNPLVVDERSLLRRFDGKTINSISYQRHDIFEDRRNTLRRIAGAVHIRTAQSALERDMLLREGQAFDTEIATTSNRIIRSRPYIADSWLDVHLNAEDTTRVDVILVTHDNWTIGVEAIGFSGQRALVSIYDYNFLGSGNRVGADMHFNYRDLNYLHTVMRYDNPNFLGTFYTANLKAGQDFDNAYANVAIYKGFILPTDYELGASFIHDRFTRFRVLNPGEIDYKQVSMSAFNLWGGMSWSMPRFGSSFYATTHYADRKFPERPDDTSPRVHPLFHNRREILFGAGFYRERFYSSTMIYGYGFQEDIPTGHRFELTGGYSWQEMGDFWYAGATMRQGWLTPIGYLFGEGTIGSYINVDDRQWWLSTLNIKGLWFSNLWDMGRSRLRQFVTLRYTHGWNRGEGAGSYVRFWKDIRPMTFNTYAAGSNRLLVNTETVVFTPLQPFGFRIAMFGFADAGWIGYNNNPFQNEFFSSFGIGVRLRNERLVFNAIQIRLGLVANARGMVRNQIFRSSTQQRMEQHRFIPTRPEATVFEWPMTDVYER